MKHLSTEALDVLNRHVAIEGESLRITKQLTDRKLYTEVNAALEALGGKWNRKAKAHLFPEPPADALDAVLMDGGFHDRKKDFDQFDTPAPLADRIVELADVHGKTVLEPSAGEGALAQAALIASAFSVTCVEKDLARVRALTDAGLHVEHADFLEWRSHTVTGELRRYQRVVMNPPFSKRQDVLHVTRAFGMLQRDGILVAVMSAGVTFRDDKLTTDFRALVDASRGSIVNLPDDSFAESGTHVRTVLVTMRAPS